MSGMPFFSRTSAVQFLYQYPVARGTGPYSPMGLSTRSFCTYITQENDRGCMLPMRMLQQDRDMMIPSRHATVNLIRHLSYTLTQGGMALRSHPQTV